MPSKKATKVETNIQARKKRIIRKSTDNVIRPMMNAIAHKNIEWTHKRKNSHYISMIR
ncbi:hypothetical protein D1AOALGA4SA_473 [Olavius algarvensis Delta 1 endosymbiont]|nr:hypothetical protein D1AOALGA4SA_473 [Olavius algarvensis Delta 1 endosymbiont]